MVGAIQFGEEDFLIQPVDGAQKDPDDCELWVGGSGCFEKCDQPGDVAVDIGIAILHGVSHTSQCSQVLGVREGNNIEELR